MLKYKSEIKNYADKHQLHMFDLDNCTYKLCGKYDFLQIYFRDSEDFFEYWGAFIEDVDEKCEDSNFIDTLDKIITKYKMIYALDDDYQILWSSIVDSSTDTNSVKSQKVGVKYFLEVGFFSEPVIYNYKNSKKQIVPLPQKFDLINEIYEPIRNKVKTQLIFDYTDELKCSKDILITYNNSEYVIKSSIFGRMLILIQNRPTQFFKIDASNLSSEMLIDSMLNKIKDLSLLHSK